MNKAAVIIGIIIATFSLASLFAYMQQPEKKMLDQRGDILHLRFENFFPDTRIEFVSQDQTRTQIITNLSESKIYPLALAPTKIRIQENTDFIEIVLNINESAYKTDFLLSGLAPRTFVTLQKDTINLVPMTPADWAGRMALSVRFADLYKNNFCLIIGDTSVRKICHMPSEKEAS